MKIIRAASVGVIVLLITLLILPISCKKDASEPNNNTPPPPPPPPPQEEGYVMTKHFIETELPCFVNIMFQVSDHESNFVGNLTTEDFEVQEDNQAISPTESMMTIKKRDAMSYVLKTVLMLDNSASVGNNIDDIKDAAIILINNKVEQQEIAVYVFSEEAVLLQDFTTDVAALTVAINLISIGYATTNLYGSVITGASRWEDNYSTEEIEQGFMILITDGSDTQGSNTLGDALNAIGSKMVYTVGLGNEQDPEALQQLGTAGYYSLTDYSELAAKFNEIQEEMSAYANSFYWLYYMSPKRGDNNHSLNLLINNNSNTSSNAYITGNFNSNGFYSVLPGISINDGITTVELMEGESYNLKAVTYLGDFVPSYSWEASSSSLATIEVNPSDNSEATIIASLTGGSQVVNIVVNDIPNDFTSTIPFIILEGPSPIANYTASPTTGEVPLTVQFAEQSTNNPTSWEWDFGDGGTSDEQNPLYIYNEVGVYSVSLKASNEYGSDTAVFNDYIVVDGPTPIAIFMVNTTLGTVPLIVNFTDMSSNNPTSWQWDFGDGNTSSERNPIHTYNNIGSYSVALSVSNVYGNTSTTTVDNYVTVYQDCPGTPAVSWQGKIYFTVQIDNQCWMRDNLNWTVGNSWCFDNNSYNCDTYGRLYKWLTIMNGEPSSNSVPSGVQGICPDGWHIPSDAEWDIIVNYLGGSSIAGGKMKEAGYTHWNLPNTGATNESGFTALPGGYRQNDGDFYDFKKKAYFWSSTGGYSSSLFRSLSAYSSEITSINFSQEIGLSVRCLKD